jgi:WS/DGAT/MGAT family acyltransferase
VARGLVPGGPLDLGRLALRTAQVTKALLLTRNPASAVGGQPELRKRVVWSHTYPLDELKVVGRLSGATLNDVLMSAVAGALHRYQVASGGRPVDLTTMVPVNVRPLDRELPKELGNRFALVFFTFPSAMSAPLERLAETKRRMDWLKHSPESLMTFGLIMAIGRTVADLERYVVDFFANKAIGVTTNVAGPTDVRYLAGTKVTGVLGWVPGSGHHTLGVCIFTYAGTVRVGFRVDAARVRNPQRLLTAFEEELGELVALAGAARHANGTWKEKARAH